jgi:type II secretion system protein H
MVHSDAVPTRAVTLLELIVLLTLIAILTGVIVPRMGRSVGRRELDEAAQRFAQTARTVHELAVAWQQICAIEVDLDGGGYAVVSQSGRNRSGQWQMLRASWLKAQRWPENVTVASFRTPDGSTASSGKQRVKFHADGTSSGAAIRLACRDDACNIVVHPHSGRVVCGDAQTTEFAPDHYDLGD